GRLLPGPENHCQGTAGRGDCFSVAPNPQPGKAKLTASPHMSTKKLSILTQQMENYVECWKQFNNFVNLARNKKFGPEDESQFLETKSILVQELELIFAAVEVNSPTKEEVHALIGNSPSLRYLSEMNEGALRN